MHLKKPVKIAERKKGVTEGTVRRSSDAASKACVVVPTEQFLFVQLKTV
jgi:hypothetical protein